MNRRRRVIVRWERRSRMKARPKPKPKICLCMCIKCMPQSFNGNEGARTLQAGTHCCGGECSRPAGHSGLREVDA